MNIKIISLLLAGFLLSGCETVYANLIQDYQEGRGSIRDYVADNFNDRRRIREACREGLILQVNKLRADDDHAKADALLASRYPPVITAKALSDREAATISEINNPHICGVAEE